MEGRRESKPEAAAMRRGHDDRGLQILIARYKPNGRRGAEVQAGRRGTARILLDVSTPDKYASFPNRHLGSCVHCFLVSIALLVSLVPRLPAIQYPPNYEVLLCCGRCRLAGRQPGLGPLHCHPAVRRLEQVWQVRAHPPKHKLQLAGHVAHVQRSALQRRRRDGHQHDDGRHPGRRPVYVYVRHRRLPPGPHFRLHVQGAHHGPRLRRQRGLVQDPGLGPDVFGRPGLVAHEARVHVQHPQVHPQRRVPAAYSVARHPQPGRHAPVLCQLRPGQRRRRRQHDAHKHSPNSGLHQGHRPGLHCKHLQQLQVVHHPRPRSVCLLMRVFYSSPKRLWLCRHFLNVSSVPASNT